MDDDLNSAKQQQLSLASIFEEACRELAIGGGSLDVWKRERLGEILASLAAIEPPGWKDLKSKAIAAFLSESQLSDTGR
jgi:hypothetical protein